MKRGLGHIEVIISFILFVSFLLFGLYFFNPLDTTRVLDSSLFYTQDEIIKNLSSELNMVSISIREPHTLNNVSIDLDIDGNARVEDVNGTKINSQKVESPIVDKIKFEQGSSRFIRVVSGDFESNSFIVENSQELLPEEYSISSTDKREVISELKIAVLNSSYTADYVGLKTQFNIPRRVDFGFSISGEGYNISNLSPPEDIEVVTDTKRLEMVRRDGSVGFVDLIVAVW